MPVTPNFGLTLPLIDSVINQNRWGDEINTGIVTPVDGILFTHQQELITRTQNYDFANFQIINAVVRRFSEVATNLGTVSGAVTLDYANGTYHYATLNGNISGLTISNPPTVGSLTLELRQDGTGSRTITLNSGVYLTVGNANVTLTTAANAKDKLRLEKRDSGVTWDVFTNLDIR